MVRHYTSWAVVVVALIVTVTMNGSGLAAESSLGERQARADQLARVNEMLADPDPTVRLVNLESIVKAGDPVVIGVALRAALTSNDKQLRGLAMRAYFARYREITLDVILPPEVLRQVDEARRTGEAERKLAREFAYVTSVQDHGGKIRVIVASYSFPDDRGMLEGRPPVPFSVSGDRFSAFVVLFRNMPACSVEFSPTTTLTFAGALACPRSWPKLDVVATIL